MMSTNRFPWLNAMLAPQPERRASLMFGLAMLVLIAILAYRTFGGLNPESLWLDDQWVMTLVLHGETATLLEILPPAPLGFIVLLNAVTTLFGPGHWQVQLIAHVSGLALVPLIGWIAWRGSGRVSLGILAATLLCFSKTHIVYMLRVKQYTLEALIALALIWLAMWCVRTKRREAMLVVCAVAVAALPFSFTAIAVGMVIVNVLGLHLLRAGSHADRPSRWVIAAGAGTYTVVALSWVWFVQMNQAGDVMYSYWTRYYLPLDDIEAIPAYARTHLMEFLTGALPSMFGWLVWILPLGIVLLLIRKPTRMIGLAIVLFYGGMLTLAAMGKYPLGGRRTDIFSYPITILTIVASLWALSRWIGFLPQLVLAVVIGRLLLLPPLAPIWYAENGDRRTVKALVAKTRPEDGIIIGPRSNWAVGCYGPWPIELVHSTTSSNGFMAVPQRDRLVALPELIGRGLPPPDRCTLEAELKPLLQSMPDRIWYLSLQTTGWWVPETLESHGYRMAWSPAESSRLKLFVRRDVAVQAP